MKALSIVSFISPKNSFWNFARFFFSKPQGPSANAETQIQSGDEPCSELNFFQNEDELENYVQSFRD